MLALLLLSHKIPESILVYFLCYSHGVNSIYLTSSLLILSLIFLVLLIFILVISFFNSKIFI